MRRLLFAAAALGALVLPAQASIVTVGSLGVDPTSSTGAFNHSLGSLVGSFDDAFTFSLDHTMTLTIASATNVFPSPKDFIGGFTGGVFAGTPSSPGAELIGPVAATACVSIPKCQGFAGSAILAAGSYFLDLRGFAHGSSGYGGNLATFAVTPLPAALPMFAGGLGLLAWFGRRRQRKN